MVKPSIFLFVAVAVCTGSLFLADLLVPLGVAVWVPYVAVVLLASWFPQRWQTYVTAAICTAMTMLGWLLVQEGKEMALLAGVNRLLGVAAIWITAVVGLAARRTLQLKEANQQLQEEIAQRERLQAQLLRTQRLESIGVLASGIAHDFNNLLTPILMAVKLLQEDRPDEERRHLLATLQASAERGAEMVRQLLAFTGGASGQRATVQAKHILKEIQAILEHSFPKTINLHIDLADNLLPVHADATQLAQVLMNLCVNARDAMPAGGDLTIQAHNVMLTAEYARLHPDARPGSYLLITVHDTGTGIPANVLDKVFDPFFTTKGPGQGTGLGLSTAMGIIRGHGGLINVYSEMGRGSRFNVYLPTVAEGESQPGEQDAAEPPWGQGELVLVVDDELFILDTARVTLENHGYQVLTAGDGREAIDLYRRHPGEIQVVILDMMMPGMDGRAAMAALKELDPKVRIIASSGLQASGSVAAAVAAGQAAFLTKPYSDQQMLWTLAKTLNHPTLHSPLGKGD